MAVVASQAVVFDKSMLMRLPDPSISLVNKSPHAFEGMRHYGPVRVVDAPAAILDQIAGRHFGFIYNGGTDRERTKTVQGWRDYLRKASADSLCKGG